jgi:thiol-disulfide isomerase/thioredoxin
MRSIILIFFHLFFFDALAQTAKIPLNNKKGSYGINSQYRKGSNIQDISAYKGYDTSNYDRWAIKNVTFNNAQRLKEEVINKNFTRIAYESIVKNDTSIDTTSILNAHIPRNLIAIFVAVKNHLKYVIVDKNGNKDFSDDEVFTFDLNKEKTYPEIDVQIDYFDGSHVRPATIPFSIDAYEGMSTNDEVSKLGIRLMDKSHKQGLYKMGREQFKITIDNPHFFLYKKEIFWLCVDYADKIEDTNDRYIYKSTDSIPIGNKLFKVQSMTDDTLYLSYISAYHKSTGEINTIAPDIVEEDLITKKPFSLYKKRGQYILLDFWGSWCAPCIDLLPGLVDIHNKYKKSGLQLVSIALDNKEDIDKLKKIIIAHDLKWDHIFTDKRGKLTIPKDYKIQIYPTTLLIDPNGKVILRGTGEKSLTKISEYLQGIYKN